MSKRKISNNEKLNAVLQYLDGKTSQGQIARDFNVSLGKYHEQHIISGYIEKYLKVKQKIFILLMRLKEFMRKARIKGIEESRMISTDIIT
ncbi:MAG: hypothetical protein BWY74_01476 [Firmicutes bacterium ADurb.Bin419]|nr:MAG: hypothetical protein BWY74_01476 [Firmicutes bacterium ADurb.Bin419]